MAGSLRVAVCALAVLTAYGALAEEPLRVATDANNVSVFSGDRPLLVYRHQNVSFKPYAQQLFTPQGVNVLRDAVPDHIHHHGLMFALGVDGVDFWSETAACGKQQHRGLANVEAVPSTDGVARAHFTQIVEWTGPAGVLLNERRTIEVARISDPPATLLTWQSRLDLPQGKDTATLTGAHYFGMGMRFLPSMDAIGKFINADGAPGEVVRGEERNTPSAWCAYTAEPEGRPVTVAGFSHPTNPRAPAVWFTMAQPFAYLSATLNLHKEPLKITAGQPLTLRYAVALWDARVDAPSIERLYRRWIAWPPPDAPAIPVK